MNSIVKAIEEAKARVVVKLNAKCLAEDADTAHRALSALYEDLKCTARLHGWEESCLARRVDDARRLAESAKELVKRLED